MKSLWEELNSLHPMPMCTRPHPCRCESMRSARNFCLEDQVIQFLIGLNDNFGVVKTQVLLLDPLLSINKVYSLVVQEESNNHGVHASSSIEDSNILVNAFEDRKPNFGRRKTNSGSFPPKNNSKYCTFRHKTNHIVAFCYQKNGFPNANKGTPSTNVVNSYGVPDSQGVVEGSSAISQTGLAQDQYVHLVSLLQQSSLHPPSSSTTSATTVHIISTPSSMTTSAGINTVLSCSLHVKSPHWLIDSGANKHICSSMSLLHSLYKIKLMHVTLPNGTSVLVHDAGTVRFSPSFHITNVLYSPHF